MSSKYIIQGGKQLTGEISIQGAKNAVTKQMVASLLTQEIVILKNVPHIGDVKVTQSMMESLGSQFQWNENTLTIDNSKLHSNSIDLSFANVNRIPILMVPGLLFAFKKVSIPHMGGCPIGKRPINFHIDSLQKMGASYNEKKHTYEFSCSQLKGVEVTLPYPSVGCTENLLLAASRAEGVTTIYNAAIEPEILDLVIMLQSMGAIIQQKANRTWIIEGVKNLKGCTHSIINDRIEAASFAACALATNSSIKIKGADPVHLQSFLNAIRKMDGDYQVDEDGILFFRKSQTLKATMLETNVHPGFMTDWQQPLVVLLTQAEGMSMIHETVYEDRFTYINALKSMGANIELSDQCFPHQPCRFHNTRYLHSAKIIGKTPLSGKEIYIPDLRAGFSYMIAAIIAEGTSILHNIAYIERGYNQIVEKFKQLGITIETEL